MKIGFTGTQRGMTIPQTEAVKSFLTSQLGWMTEFHHGDCIGADAEADLIVRRYVNIPKTVIVIHPPKKDEKRAWCPVLDIEMWATTILLDPKDYLDRNRDIVEQTDILVAASAGMTENQRSGTWYTVRHARRLKKGIFIYFPDGSYNVETSSGETIERRHYDSGS